MTYPSLEQYQEALQHPNLALLDPELKSAKVAESGFGLPRVMCGGFALTYTLTAQGRKYAVRCFHKTSPSLELRYEAISAKLKQLQSSYFLPFEFQSQGVRIQKKTYPIVKMAWSTGETLGDFVAANYSKGPALANLVQNITALAGFMEAQQISHGDLQPGNLMVGPDGSSVSLIDYDGMFVPAIQHLGAAEIGHRNFQHPKRNAQHFSASLDRFSAISLHVALRVLQQEPALWDQTQSDSDSFVFRASDFADPGSSAAFQRLFSRPQLAAHAKNLAAICIAPFEKTPTLEEFLTGRNIPQIQLQVSRTPSAPTNYSSQYPVLEATDYLAFSANVGNRVELVGKVTGVKKDVTRHGGTYIFVNFGPWQLDHVKLAIWPDHLSKMTNPPSSSLEGKWIRAVGLVQVPYSKGRYKSISIDITSQNQIQILSEQEAQFRLGATSPWKSSPRGNQEVLERLRGGSEGRTQRHVGRQQTTAPSPPIRSPNEAILANIQRAAGRSSRPAQPPTPPRRQAAPAHPQPAHPQAASAQQPSPRQAPNSSSEDSSGFCGLLVVGAVLLFAWALRH